MVSAIAVVNNNIIITVTLNFYFESKPFLHFTHTKAGPINENSSRSIHFVKLFWAPLLIDRLLNLDVGEESGVSESLFFMKNCFIHLGFIIYFVFMRICISMEQKRKFASTKVLQPLIRIAFNSGIFFAFLKFLFIANV